MSDLHGSKDITLECDDNLLIKNKTDIVGCTFNHILLSLFTLYSTSKQYTPLPVGKKHSWKLLEESLCVMLLTIATVDHLLQRIFHLIICASFDTCHKKYQYLAEGALSFISHWISKYWRFISPQNFVRMKRLLEEFHCHFLRIEILSNYALHTLADLLKKCIAACLKQAIKGAVPPIIKTAVVGTWDKTSEKMNLLDGSLVSIQKSKAIEMRKPTTSNPPVIAIFGVTQDMLDLSDDDDDDNDDVAVVIAAALPESDDKLNLTPESRIPNGYDMMQDYNCVSIWDFDVKELARQWTLMDHSLFLAIPLTNLQCCRWADPRHLSEANEVRRFIDRFNAESCWVTQSLLNQDTPQRRAALYMKFIFLASFLEELNNFNGLMAILTAVQQGCITRLIDTLSYVDDKSKQMLKRLQILMSGSMNYMKYRECVSTVLDKDHKCIVPHLGAHLAEICSIEEGNTSYLLGASHLLNVEKLQLFGRCFLQIGKMQTRIYHLYPLKLIQVCLLSEFRQGQYMSSTAAAQWSKNMYSKSLQMEGHSASSQTISKVVDLSQSTENDNKSTLLKRQQIRGDLAPIAKSAGKIIEERGNGCCHGSTNASSDKRSSLL